MNCLKYFLLGVIVSFSVGNMFYIKKLEKKIDLLICLTILEEEYNGDVQNLPEFEDPGLYEREPQDSLPEGIMGESGGPPLNGGGGAPEERNFLEQVSL